jgi:hypothetical protein
MPIWTYKIIIISTGYSQVGKTYSNASASFSVVSGKTTYLGEFLFLPLKHKMRLFGLGNYGGWKVVVSNKLDRDLELVGATPVGSVIAEVPNFDDLANPFLGSRP